MKLCTAFEPILKKLYPPRCPFCDGVLTADGFCCAECRGKLWETPLTPRAPGGVPCVAPYPYLPPHSDAILRLKFRRRPDYAKRLVTPMVTALHLEHQTDFDAVTFVPMHPRRQVKRGYNQAKLLAREVAAALELPCLSLLKKTRDNPPQHRQKTVADKQKNVRGLFRLTDADAVKGKCVLLVDDVVTSGSTLGECAKSLLRGGAVSVFCVTVCASPKL